VEGRIGEWVKTFVGAPDHDEGFRALDLPEIIMKCMKYSMYELYMYEWGCSGAIRVWAVGYEGCTLYRRRHNGQHLLIKSSQVAWQSVLKSYYLVFGLYEGGSGILLQHS